MYTGWRFDRIGLLLTEALITHRSVNALTLASGFERREGIQISFRMQNGLGASADFCAEVNGAKHLRAQRTPRLQSLLAADTFSSREPVLCLQACVLTRFRSS